MEVEVELKELEESGQEREGFYIVSRGARTGTWVRDWDRTVLQSSVAVKGFKFVLSSAVAIAQGACEHLECGRCDWGWIFN